MHKSVHPYIKYDPQPRPSCREMVETPGPIRTQSRVPERQRLLNSKHLNSSMGPNTPRGGCQTARGEEAKKKTKQTGWVCTTRHPNHSKILLTLRETHKNNKYSTLNTHSTCTPVVSSHKTGNVEREAPAGCGCRSARLGSNFPGALGGSRRETAPAQVRTQITPVLTSRTQTLCLSAEPKSVSWGTLA